MLHRPPSLFDTDHILEKIQQLNAPAILRSAQTQCPHPLGNLSPHSQQNPKKKNTAKNDAPPPDETLLHFGYKNHVTIDEEYKLIRGYGVTGAAAHDSVPYLDVLSAESAYPAQEAFADSAYSGKDIEAKLKERGYLPMVCEKGYRNHPLSEEQKKMNRLKSGIRCRVEHVFGVMKMRMGDETLRSIGFGRVRFWIGVRNLPCQMSNGNMCRFVSLRVCEGGEVRGRCVLRFPF